MSKGINVKVGTDKVTTALKKSLKTKQDELAKYDKANADYELATKKYNEKIVAQALKMISKAKSTSVNTRWNGEVTLNIEFDASQFTIGKAPEQDPQFKNFYRGSHTSEIAELENAIRIIEMSEEPYVNASTMRSISQYL